MKKKNSKLKLSKQIISKLSKDQSVRAIGGSPTSLLGDCDVPPPFDANSNNCTESGFIIAHNGYETRTQPGQHIQLFQQCFLQ